MSSVAFELPRQFSNFELTTIELTKSEAFTLWPVQEEFCDLSYRKRTLIAPI